MKKIERTRFEDLAFICTLFDEAINYQKKKNFPVWNGYDIEAFKKDISAGNQYKILIEDQIAIVFSVCYTDEIIWREKENGDSLYLHRIAVNPLFKGQKLFGDILNWAIEHVKTKKLLKIRMDTWGDNSTIIDYYKSFGFNFIENYTTPNTLDLPIQHRNVLLALLELNVGQL